MVSSTQHDSAPRWSRFRSTTSSSLLPGVALSLLHRIRDLHRNRVVTHCLYRAAPATALLYQRARRTGWVVLRRRHWGLLRSPRTTLDWEVEGDRARLTPCAYCGSRRIYVTRLMEVTGGLCRGCRRDREGVYWSRRYDRWLDMPKFDG